MSANRRLLFLNFSINSAGMCGTQRKSSSKVELRQQANFIRNQP